MVVTAWCLHGEAGESSEVDVVLCGDDPLLVGVGDCLVVVGDAMHGVWG